MDSSYAPPYAPLRCLPVLPLSPLPKPAGFHGTWLDFAKTLPSGRMNILETDGHHLYLGHCRESVAIYAISRSRGVQLIPIFSAPVEPAVTINNLRVADFPDDNGGSLLLMTGGREDGIDYASVSVLKIPSPALVATQDDDALHSFWSKNKSRACTITIPECSAWGLDVHNPTGRFAVSANSCTILVLSFRGANLMAVIAGQVVNESDGERFPEETLSLVADPISDTFGNNIPTVMFSPCGNLLASGSIDHSFALHDVRSGNYSTGERLFQSYTKEPASDVAWDEFVWCVHWVGEDALCDVPSADDVWLESDIQTIRHGSEVREGLSYWAPSRKSIFADIAGGDIAIVDERDGVARYDDCVEPEPAMDAASARQWCDDQLREHRLCTDVDGRSRNQERYDRDASDGKRVQTERVCYREEVCGAHNTEDQTRKQVHNGSKMDAPMDTERHLHQDEETERLLLVGRELNLYLYRITGSRPGKTSKPFVKELHHLQVYSRPFGYPNSAFLDCLELTRLSAFVLVARGHGVFLVRLLREANGVAGGNLRLYIERAFPQRIRPSQAEPWRRDQTGVLGVCVVPRGEEGSVTECYELWILWKDGMIEAWELSRGELAVDPSVVV